MKPTQNPRHLAPDDPRHGTQAGYVAGCRCEPCRVGRYRAQKESRLYALQNNGTCRAPTDQVSALIQQWIGQGIGVNAVARAAGLNNNTLRTTTVSRWTIDALERLSEDDFPPFTRVYADLTRKRVYSLMAAGHQMVDMPIRRTGTWRTTEKCTARMARDIREHYLSHEMTMGDCATTASRARNAGHEIPAAWDDPGTLAWPETSRHVPTTRHTNCSMRSRSSACSTDDLSHATAPNDWPLWTAGPTRWLHWNDSPGGTSTASTSNGRRSPNGEDSWR